MDPDRLSGILEFLTRVEPLKHTLRSAHTSSGMQENSAAHSWRLCLMAMLLADEFDGVDALHLIKLCIVHDIAEAVVGDVPAPEQGGQPDKQAVERAAMLEIAKPLPEDLGTQVMSLWEEYEAGDSVAAIAAKGLDKLETIHQHNAGANPTDFDYAFNLDYGRNRTNKHPLLDQIRDQLDAATRANIK
ncbi:MAG: HD domain-containing protein [Rhizobiaceae bacterium]|nr:HD domain-containing protein [Rhizobiaceae bacterium]